MSFRCEPRYLNISNQSELLGSLSELQLAQKMATGQEEAETNDEEQHLDILLKKMVQKLHQNEKAYISLQDQFEKSNAFISNVLGEIFQKNNDFQQMSSFQQRKITDLFKKIDHEDNLLEQSQNQLKEFQRQIHYCKMMCCLFVGGSGLIGAILIYKVITQERKYFKLKRHLKRLSTELEKTNEKVANLQQKTEIHPQTKLVQTGSLEPLRSTYLEPNLKQNDRVRPQKIINKQ